ncbi:MAG: RHS repeat-associated core domain-containing protein, partial [Phycisphaerae bacterium]|nr:RHS repeat-associated core domain-containing protein [Saprospiraceae bacterium]
FFDNQVITGDASYIYDALYRLTEATGRENGATLAFDSSDNWNDAAFMRQLQPNDQMAVRNYTQRYQYDAVGNILQMRHLAQDNNWTRNYNYQSANNRLISTKIGANTFNYPHHAQHGFMTAMPHLEDMGWNFKEEIIRTIRMRRADGGTPETTYYQYDGQGQRIRKITENMAGPGNTPTLKDARIYIAGYEVYQEYSVVGIAFERRSLSLLEEGHRFVMVETSNELIDNHLVRYQMHNHLGSAALELDAAAEVISYEEYHPFGTTAYQAKNAAIKAAAKRYRYTGMERDEETGLEYHSARYYLPWLGRWGSADPIGVGDGVNVYRYTRTNPINKIDQTGKQTDKPLTIPNVDFGEIKKKKFKKDEPSDDSEESEDIDIGDGDAVSDIQHQIYGIVIGGVERADFDKFKNLFIKNPGVAVTNNPLANYKLIDRDGDGKASKNDHIYINILGPDNGSVRIKSVNSTKDSFSANFITQEGHTDAGQVMFNAVYNEKNKTLFFTVQNISQTNSAGPTFVGVGPALARSLQKLQWRNVLGNVAASFGDKAVVKKAVQIIKEYDFDDNKPAKIGELESVDITDITNDYGSYITPTESKKYQIDATYVAPRFTNVNNVTYFPK